MDWNGHAILAPLTKGGNLPFRRLCVDFGAHVTMSEMAYARQVTKRSKSELALLRKHASEPVFGVQIAARAAQEAIAAAQAAIERGAAFIDLNCGCPIHDVVRRGMGATLLQQPNKLARLVTEMVKGIPVPVTVKIRAGWDEEHVNAPEVARLLEEAGAAAVTLHARTREQRYTKSADWSLVARLVSERRIPIIGNGDLLTWYETAARRAESGCASVMLGRGPLIKPWLFQEIRDGRAFEPSPEQRVAILRKLTVYMQEHFRVDEKGKERTMRFLPWHLGFFCRYRPLPIERYGEQSKSHPLMQTRLADDGEPPLLERVLRDPREEVHLRLANELWDAKDDADAVERFLRVGTELPPVSDVAGEVGVGHG